KSRSAANATRTRRVMRIVSPPYGGADAGAGLRRRFALLRRFCRHEAERVIGVLGPLLHHSRFLREDDLLLRRVADDAERVLAGRDRGDALAHHLAHLDDAAVGHAEMLVWAIGDHALLLDRHAILIVDVDAPPIVLERGIFAVLHVAPRSVEGALVARIEADEIEQGR